MHNKYTLYSPVSSTGDSTTSHTKQLGSGDAGRAEAPQRGAVTDNSLYSDQATALNRVGLSISHISPQGFGLRPSGPSSRASLPLARLKIARGGSVARLSGPRLSSVPTGGKRGKVKLFSRASQQRLRVLLASIDRESVAYLPLLVTLTYPSEWSASYEDWKTHLDSFSKRLMRQYPAAASVWVLEFQRRGAPHFHLVVFGVRAIDHRWLARSWYEIVASGDEKHLRAGTRVERARKWNALQAYITKYVSKVESKQVDIPDGVGRWWGVLNRNKLSEMIQWYEAVIPLTRFWQLRRVLRSWLLKRGVKRFRSSAAAGVMVFMPSAAVMRLL